MKEDLLNKILSVDLLMGSLSTLELEIRRCAYNRKRFQHGGICDSYKRWNQELQENMKYRTYVTNVLVNDYGLDGAVIKDTISGVDKRVVPMKNVVEIVELIKNIDYSCRGKEN